MTISFKAPIMRTGYKYHTYKHSEINWTSYLASNEIYSRLYIEGNIYIVVMVSIFIGDVIH